MHQAIIWLGLSIWFDPFNSLSLQPECLCTKTHLTRLIWMETIWLHLIDLIYLTHFPYSLGAHAPRQYLTIWLHLVKWSRFDSIWSIRSIRLTVLTVWVLKHQDTIWLGLVQSSPFNSDWFGSFESLSLQPECLCTKTPFDRLSSMKTVWLHLIDSTYLTHFPWHYWLQAVLTVLKLPGCHNLKLSIQPNVILSNYSRPFCISHMQNKYQNFVKNHGNRFIPCSMFHLCKGGICHYISPHAWNRQFTRICGVSGYGVLKMRSVENTVLKMNYYNYITHSYSNLGIHTKTNGIQVGTVYFVVLHVCNFACVLEITIFLHYWILGKKQLL